MNTVDVLVISPFRRPDFRHAVSPSHPFEEPFDSPPFVTAAVCEEAGFESSVLALQNIYAGFDEATDLTELKGIIDEYNPRLVLFSGDHFIASRSTATVYGMRIVASIIQQQSDALIGACGRLATTMREGLLAELPELDFIVVGEAEQILGELVTVALAKGTSGLVDRPHVITRNREAHDPPAEPAYVSQPDSLPLPAFHLAMPSVERLNARRSFGNTCVPFSIRTSFGCKFRCRFCAGIPHWTDYRTKSRARIAAEVDYLYECLPGIARLSFLEDEISTRYTEHVRSFTAVLRERDIVLDGLYTHATLLTSEIAEMLVPVVDRVFLGLDSPQDEILRTMGKGQRLETVLAAVSRAHSAGLRAHLEWIIGSPPETVDSLITSLHAIFSLLTTGAVDSINTYVYCPHPGTDYAEHADVHDLTLHESFDMLESGGYPASSTSRLSREQVFTAYLMSQLLIGEATEARRQFRGGSIPRPPARSELDRLFRLIGGPR